ncbi:ubiquitin-like-conjugating enzyme ATG3, partial [Tremellales sp. Uapishka_1]
MNNPLLAIQVTAAKSRFWRLQLIVHLESILGGARLPVTCSAGVKVQGAWEDYTRGVRRCWGFPDLQVPRLAMLSREKGDASRARDFLPPDKQYLITRNVPCLRRATAINYTDADEDAEKLMNFLDEAEEAPGPDGKPRHKDEDDWVATHIGRAPQPSASNPTSLGDIPDISDSPPLKPTAPVQEIGNLKLDDAPEAMPKEDEIPDMDDIPDMEDEAEGLEEEGDDAAVKIVHPSEDEVKSTVGQNLLQVRTYDCLISYDKHYQTPRFWLLGYDENKTPLTPTQVFQDVPADHAFKTMTMEPFPHSGQQLASVHPCKHASVMKKFIDRMEDAQPSSPAATSAAGKKKWGIGGMVRKVTGGVVTEKDKEKEKKEGEEAQETGLQVDFYLVIVDSTTAF